MNTKDTILDSLKYENKVSTCLALVRLITEANDFFDYIDLIPPDIITELKQCCRECNHPDEQPIRSTVNIIGEHSWSHERKKEYFSNKRKQLFLAYRKFFRYFFPNETFPEYKRLRFMGKINFVKIINDNVVIFDKEGQAMYDPYSIYPYILKTSDKYISFNILEREDYRLKRDEQIDPNTDVIDDRIIMTFGRSGYITDLDPKICLETGNPLYIDRRSPEEQKQNIQKWIENQ